MDSHHTRPARIAPAASAEQTAAIVAALERFWRATSAAPPPAQTGAEQWRRAALVEGVSREPSTDVRDPWINT